MAVRCSLHLIIQDPEEYLRSLELSNFVLSKNMEDKMEQPSAGAYILHFYESHRSHILYQELET